MKTLIFLLLLLLTVGCANVDSVLGKVKIPTREAQVAGEVVAQSVPQSDLDGDGYVTGRELTVLLSTIVAKWGELYPPSAPEPDPLPRPPHP